MIGAPNVYDVPSATTPNGARGTIKLTDREPISGELIAVTDSSFLIAATRVTEVPFTLARVCSFDPFKFRCSQRSDLRMISRYPYGMPADALAGLLAARNQPSLDVLR
jgi:hypothetical protein